jgi:hypothetical protein
VKRIIVVIVLWFAGGMALLQGLVTAVRWWHGEIGAMTAIDWLWLALLPPLLYAYLRHVSILGCKQPTCLLPDERQDQESDR